MRQSAAHHVGQRCAVPVGQQVARALGKVNLGRGQGEKREDVQQRDSMSQVPFRRNATVQVEAWRARAEGRLAFIVPWAYARCRSMSEWQVRIVKHRKRCREGADERPLRPSPGRAAC